MPTYNYNPIASGAARVGASAVGTGSVTATSTGGGAIKTAYMPQGFQADFGSGGMGVRGEGGRETAPEPMHVSQLIVSNLFIRERFLLCTDIHVLLSFSVILVRK